MQDAGSIVIDLTLHAAFVRIHAWLGQPGWMAMVFSGDIIYTGDDVCGDTDNTVNNESATGPCIGTGTVGIDI